MLDPHRIADDAAPAAAAAAAAAAALAAPAHVHAAPATAASPDAVAPDAAAPDCSSPLARMLKNRCVIFFAMLDLFWLDTAYRSGWLCIEIDIAPYTLLPSL